MLGQATTPDQTAITWVGLLSGGLPVGAFAIVICWILWRALEKERKRNDDLVERMIAREGVLVPLLKDTGDALMRTSILMDRQASSNQAGRQ
jgi:hypothetical protein